MQRVWPTTAPHGGSFTLTGNGSANDVIAFPLTAPGISGVAAATRIIVQNDTAATIYVVPSQSATAATQGDEAVPSGAEYVGDEYATYVGIYGAAGTHVNGTASGGIVVYGEVL